MHAFSFWASRGVHKKDQKSSLYLLYMCKITAKNCWVFKVHLRSRGCQTVIIIGKSESVITVTKRQRGNHTWIAGGFTSQRPGINYADSLDPPRKCWVPTPVQPATAGYDDLRRFQIYGCCKKNASASVIDYVSEFQLRKGGQLFLQNCEEPHNLVYSHDEVGYTTI